MTEPVTNYTALNFYFHVLSWALGGVAIWYSRRASRNKKTEERLTHVEQRVDGIDCAAHKTRTGAVEKSVIELRAELAHLPTQQQFTQLNASISNLNGALQMTSGRLEGVNRAVDLINEYLINQGSRK